MREESEKEILRKEACEKYSDYIDFYFKNQMRELNKIVLKIMKTPQFCWFTDLEDIYDLVPIIFYKDVIGSYKEEMGDFDAHLYCVLKKKIWTYIHKYLAADSRSQYIYDEFGNKKMEFNEQTGKSYPIKVALIRLDAPVYGAESDIVGSIGEKTPSVVDIENEFINRNQEESSRISIYKSRLSNREQKIVDLLECGYDSKRICEILGITNRQFNECMADITCYENINILM